jgi:C4-dicarboxylate transporter, DctQ subunit
MTAARKLLDALTAFEKTVCVAGFALICTSLIADVGSRIVLGSGIVGAPQIGVIGMIAVAFFGFGIAAATGGQLRARFLDFVFPKAWDTGVNRVADLLTAALLCVLTVLCALMTAEALRLGDVNSVLRWPIWPVQAIIVVALALNTLRYLLFAFFPDLRPSEDPVPETAETESPIR